MCVGWLLGELYRSSPMSIIAGARLRAVDRGWRESVGARTGAGWLAPFSADGRFLFRKVLDKVSVGIGVWLYGSEAQKGSEFVIMVYWEMGRSSRYCLKVRYEVLVRIYLQSRRSRDC